MPRVALDTGVNGLDVVIGTSSQLRQFSHGKSIDEIIDIVAEVLTWIRSQAPSIELRFSTEDSFRSEEAELLRVYLAVDKLGVVNRLGTADTVGIATPMQVSRLVGTLRRVTHCDIEFHGHNDSGCAIANACGRWRRARRTSTRPCWASASATASRRWAASSPGCTP